MFSFAQDENKDTPRPERGGQRGPGGPGAGRGVPKEILDKYDANKDGTLDADERKTLREAQEKEADTNGDGTVDADERKAAMVKRMTPRFDENGDGKLDKDEQATLDAMMARFSERGPRGDGQGRPGGRRGADGQGRPNQGGDKAPDADSDKAPSKDSDKAPTKDTAK
jgi:hypothetical protein